MSVRELLLAGASSERRGRTFILDTNNTVRVYENKSGNLTLQGTPLSLPSSVAATKAFFVPNQDFIIASGGGNIYCFAWDKDTGFGSQVGSALAGGQTLHSVSPAGDAVSVTDSEDSKIIALSQYGFGAVLATATNNGSGLIFSSSGNYIISNKEESLQKKTIYDWNVSTGIGSSYDTPTLSVFGFGRAAQMSKDDSHIIVGGNSGAGGLEMFPFDGSSFGSRAGSLALNVNVIEDIAINERQNAVAIAAADSTSPFALVSAVPYSLSGGFGSTFGQPTNVLSNSSSNNVAYGPRSNIVAFSQTSNFGVSRITSDGWGTATFTDSSGSDHWTDIIEVDA